MRRNRTTRCIRCRSPAGANGKARYGQPDWARVHRELARVGVTLRILHGEYADECAAAGRPRMGCDRFRKQYAAYAARTGVTSRVEHKAGHTIEVDWAGKTMRIVDPVTGDESKAYLFVCFCKLASTVWALFFSSIGGWFPAETAPSEPAAPFSLVIWS